MGEPGCGGGRNVTARAGGILRLGGYDWRVLDVKDDMLLILSDKIIARKAYGTTSKWEACELRRYLNGPFYDETFTAEEKALIAETRLAAKAGPLYGAAFGADSADRVFLLSVEEVVRYFGDSGQLADGRVYIDDAYSPARVARDNTNGAASWWYLRSPGGPDELAVCVGDDGGVYVAGHGITVGKAGAGGVRPALWLRLGA